MVVHRTKQKDQWNEVENSEIEPGINEDSNITEVDFPLSGMAQAQMMWQKCLP